MAKLKKHLTITTLRYISLKKNWYRRVLLKSLLFRQPFKIIRFDGVKFDFNNHNYDKYLTYGIQNYLYAAQDRLCGVVGCWIAHSLVLEGITETDGITVVLEDDFVCHRDFFDQALRMVNEFEQEFDIILFDSWGKGPIETHKISDNIYNTERCGYPYYNGTHCLFVNNARVRNILEAKLTSPVCDYDGFVYGSGKINSFVFYTGKSGVRNLGSDITSGYKSKYDIQSLLMCLLPYSWKERTEKFKKQFHKLSEIKFILLSKESLKTFEGYYILQTNKKVFIRFSINENNYQLTMIFNNKELLLSPISANIFFCREYPCSMKFIKDETGSVLQFVLFEKEVYNRAPNYIPIIPVKITLSLEQLKDFEGTYQLNKGVTMNITAMADYLHIIQLWDLKEFCFVAESDLEFFVSDNPSYFIRFIRSESGSIHKVIVMEKATLNKIVM